MKGEKQSLLAQVYAQIDDLAEQAGEREAARLSYASMAGKSDATTADALAAGQAKREEVRERLRRAFHDDGRLPPGIRDELLRLTHVPTVGELSGVITVNTNVGPIRDD